MKLKELFGNPVKLVTFVKTTGNQQQDKRLDEREPYIFRMKKERKKRYRKKAKKQKKIKIKG